jgi:hypothetical protein
MRLTVPGEICTLTKLDIKASKSTASKKAATHWKPLESEKKHVNAAWKSVKKQRRTSNNMEETELTE